ncbi:M20 metallopeptidase family protein [Anaeropeptidivorans aminofermentans]|jgi:amidohydrolase|uniref:M20 metallopeptidase family protein n=1 Tax=Anaeropeptidivorans aminofermentans TaxID=2934315 RepID=UPI002024AB58|nr:M20 family metallopeptidase [Anaeropeptidivorans aminofermentans]MBE6012716.1 amidohydrolase [Lachnospiraceae bacterium]
MENILNLALEIENEIIKWRRELHQIPEVGTQLPKTCEYIKGKLDEMGIPYTCTKSVTGIVALIEGGSPGKTVALRSDMDALPVLEETGLDFKSTNGSMHACGHDAHSAMLLGAAKILNDHKSELKGNVKLIFQPGEESPGGAEPMIKEGCLENPKVDAIFGQHIGVLIDGLKTGEVAVSYGNAMACRDAFKIAVKGRGAHSSTPHLSIDPVAIAAQIINGIYMIKARELDALSPSVISVCMIHGGTASNIIPEKVEMEGSTRSIDPKVRKFIAERIEQVVKTTCETYGADYEFEFSWDYPVLTNHKEMAEMVIEGAGKILGSDKVFVQPQAIMGSEDMSFFLNEVPGAYYFLGSVVSQDGVVYGHHNPKFLLDESVFAKGSAVMVQLVQDYLNQ